ncbi:MAG: hypothetical protein IJB79_02860 [Candidatus Gastranaerophilales bacterium]|nr:hypothetical protein [Candidatus Gastranaerophilales bacterium]
MKKVFTLAETMIVLVVIGVLSAILLPVINKAQIDKKLMKFKNAHNALYSTLGELVSSDKYYLNGDLGIKTDGTLLKSKVSYYGCPANLLGDDNSVKYLCETIADVIQAKSINCSTENAGNNDHLTFMVVDELMHSDWHYTTEAFRTQVDRGCRMNASKVGEEIVAKDGTVYYQTNPNATFGIVWAECIESDRLFGLERNDSNFTYSHYKPFCIDIDGIPEGATENNCINECPFGYGLRADGKILNGARAQEWLEKTMNDE